MPAPTGEAELSKYTADDMPSIAQRLKEIEAEKVARINGISLEDAKPVEAPADIDFGMYTPCGYTVQRVGIEHEPDEYWWGGSFGMPAYYVRSGVTVASAPTPAELFEAYPSLKDFE
jgi:hypothetical protein